MTVFPIKSEVKEEDKDVAAEVCFHADRKYLMCYPIIFEVPERAAEAVRGAAAAVAAGHALPPVRRHQVGAEQKQSQGQAQTSRPGQGRPPSQ